MNMPAHHNSEHKLMMLLAVGLVGVFAFMQVYSIQAILPELMRDLHATEVQAGLAVGATVLGVAVMSPFMGMLSDAFGRKWLIVASILFLTVPTVLISGVSDIREMMVYRFLQGLAVPGITVVLIAYVGEEYSGKILSMLMSFYVSGTVLGGFSGRFVLGYLNDWIGWRQAFLVMAAMSAAGSVLVWKQLPASKNFVAKPDMHVALETLWHHLHDRYVLTACALGACVLFTLVGCFTFINLHLAHEPYHLNSAQLANIFTIYLFGMVVTPMAARLINRFGPVGTVIFAVLLSVAGVLATLVHPLWGIIVALTAMSSGVFITQSATISYIAVNVKEGRSLASGLYYMAYYGGGTLGAWVCGLAFAHSSWKGVVFTLLGVQVLALLIAAKGMVKTCMVSG